MNTEQLIAAIKRNEVEDGVAGLSVWVAQDLAHIAWSRIPHRQVMLSSLDRLSRAGFELYQKPNDPGHFVVLIEPDNLARIAVLRSCFDAPIMKAKLLASLGGGLNSENGRKEQR